MNKKSDLTIDDLARMTQDQFSVVDERFDKLEAGQQRIESGIQKVLDIVLELPSKKVIERLTHKVEDLDEEVAAIKSKLQVSHQ